MYLIACKYVYYNARMFSKPAASSIIDYAYIQKHFFFFCTHRTECVNKYCIYRAGYIYIYIRDYILICVSRISVHKDIQSIGRKSIRPVYTLQTYKAKRIFKKKTNFEIIFGFEICTYEP